MLASILLTSHHVFGFGRKAKASKTCDAMSHAPSTCAASSQGACALSGCILVLLMVNTIVSIAVVVAETSSTLAMSSYTVPQSNP